MKSLLFYIVALVFLSSCGGGGSESSDQTNQTQADETIDVNQESISQTETFGGSSFGGENITGCIGSVRA